MLGIGKRQLLEDYYFDEFLMVLRAHNEMNKLDRDDIEEVSAEDW